MSELSLDSAEGYFEQLRQIMIFGETWVDAEANTIRYRPDEYPWDLLRLGGRGFGKTTPLTQWIDEMAQARAAEERVLRDVAARGLTPPEPDDTPLTIRWACLKPTDPPTRVVCEGQYAVVKQGIRPEFGDLLRRWMQMR